jgi:hypothetical protein
MEVEAGPVVVLSLPLYHPVALVQLVILLVPVMVPAEVEVEAAPAPLQAVGSMDSLPAVFWRDWLSMRWIWLSMGWGGLTALTPRLGPRERGHCSRVCDEVLACCFVRGCISLHQEEGCSVVQVVSTAGSTATPLSIAAPSKATDSTQLLLPPECCSRQHFWQ